MAHRFAARRCLYIVGLLVACGANAQTLYYADPGGAESLSGAFSSLVWSTDDCTGGAFQVCAIRHGSGSGGSPLVRYSFNNSLGDPDDSVGSNVAQAGSSVYWLSDGGEVLRRHYGYGTGPPEVISAMETPGAVGEIAADEDHVWWIENVAGEGTLFRAPYDGGPREYVADSPDGIATNLQLDGAGRAYYIANANVVLLCCAGVLHQIEPDGIGGFTTTFAARANTDGYVVDENEVFSAHRLSPTGDLLIASAPADDIDTGASWVDHHDAGSLGPPSIQHMALSDDDVFWHEERPLGGGPILRMPRSGGPPAAITLAVSEAKDLHLVRIFEDPLLYWLDGGVIYKTSALGAPITRDLDADDIDLEVVQVIQDSLGAVPLTENKRTHVRVFARLASASDGATQVDVFPAVMLYGTRGGVPLPDSPLRPIDRLQPLLDASVKRSSSENQFLFRLPESWTSGTVQLTATVDPRDVVFESDETNNSTTRTVTFDAVQGICVDIIPVNTTNGVEQGGSLADRAQTFDRARTVLPTDDIVWIFRGGSPKSKPWSGDPYNFQEEDDAHELMFNWFFDFNTSGTPSQCRGRRTIRTAAVTSARRFGISSGAAALIMYKQQMGGATLENVPIGGVAGLAHELGHQLGQGHIGCPVSGNGAPGNPDGGYPYSPCNLDSTNENIGVDAISRRLITPFDLRFNPLHFDFMSYNGPYWVSDYVYVGHHNELASSSPSPPVAGGGSLVIGGYQIDGGNVELGHGYDLDATMTVAAGTQIGANAVPSSDYFLRIYDVDGELQVDEPLYESPMPGEEAIDKSSTSFIGLVEYQSDYEKVEIRDASSNVLASKSYGPRAPSVTILSPLGGAVLGDSVQVIWTGTDPDPGDVLEYRLYYSNDGGSTWQDVVATRATQATVDMVSMPTGASAWFRVLVSDGVHSSDDAVGPIAIANRPPEVVILTDDSQAPTGPLTWVFGEENALRGYGYDSDDGPLSGASLSWNVLGPTSGGGAGERLLLPDLAPGDYQIDLTATDGGGLSTVASQQVRVAPREIAELPEEPSPVVVDGRCQDTGYANDGQRMVLRYANGEIAEIAASEVGDYLHFCFSGLSRNEDFEYIELRLDPDRSADTEMQADDLFVRLYRNGLIESGIGDGNGGDELEALTLDVLGAVADLGGPSWQAELRLHESLVSTSFGLGALHDEATGNDVGWPLDLDKTGPDTWGHVTLLPEPGVLAGLLAGAGALCGLARRRER